MYPIGYSDKPVPDTSIQESDKNLVEKRCWDVALGPLKQLPMNLFIMYMSGNTISIFPIMMVCMMAWRPIQALMSMSASHMKPHAFTQSSPVRPQAPRGVHSNTLLLFIRGFLLQFSQVIKRYD
uniref:ER membrane protein complex subunit 4 n=1 Tax=Oncorhynchus tshawytscha TaxID=74940 RepID=A0AAZ3PUZ7_ONCTS